jgi:hypothetical protein
MLPFTPSTAINKKRDLKERSLFFVSTQLFREVTI